VGRPQRNIGKLLKPRVMAVVGASERPGPGRQVIQNLEHVGFAGQIIPINPKYEQLFSRRCYPSLKAAHEDLGAIDAVAILLGRDHLLPVLEQANEVGVGGGWAFASGFSETGDEGRALQARLTAFCDEHEIAFCGPNCVGFVNPAAATAAFSAPISPGLVSGNVGAVAQSGSIALALINSARGIGFSAVVSSGNEAVLDCTDYLDHFIEDPNTHVLLAFIEQLRRPDRFIEVADAARKAGKPLIVLKVGRSEIAQRATIAHTGALAGADAVYDEVFRKHGVLRVHDMDEMLETAEAFSRLGRDLPSGKRIGMLTVSGGEISLIADLAEEMDLTFPEWSETTQMAFAKELPDYADIANPLDAWGAGRIEETYARCVDAAAEDDIDLLMISQDGPRGLAEEQIEQYATVARAAADARRRTGKPIIAFSHLAGGLDPTLQRLFAEGGVPFLQGTRYGLLAAKHLTDFTAASSSEIDTGWAAERGRLSDLARTQHGVLDEIDSKAVLREYGIPCVTETLCKTTDEAVEAAKAMGGQVVLKVVSSALPHKTDAGVVALGLEGDDAVRRSYDEIMQRASSHVSENAIRGVVVQEMVHGAVAEVIIGLTLDPTFGPIVVFGLGGITVELFKDRALGIPPIARNAARTMIERTRASKLLRGFRGQAAGDLDALESTLTRVGNLALDLGERLVSVDVNPLLVLPNGQGVVAVDGLIELARPGVPKHEHRGSGGDA